MKYSAFYSILLCSLISSSLSLASPNVVGLLGIDSLNNPEKLFSLDGLSPDILTAKAERIREREEFLKNTDDSYINENDEDRSKIELSGALGLESVAFTQTASAIEQDHSSNFSFVAEPEWLYQWDNGNQLIAFKPFLRIDDRDEERTHFDIRELIYEKANSNSELRLGIGKVFWGVTEFQHVIDIINQTDLVENIDTEDKLGQPLINFAWIQDWGTLDFFLLPYFRERTFPGSEGRLRTQPRVDIDNPIYESSAEEKHLDTAIRYSHFFGDWDIGLAHFYGTSREPRFVFANDAAGQPVLRPLYEIINQTSIDLQATKGDWLWKLEGFHRRGQDRPFTSIGSGFEYTFVGAFESNIDVGVIAEYYYDSRGEDSISIFEDDIVVGARIAFNDAQSSEFLSGLVWDRNTGGKFLNLEANRRLGDNFFLELQGRFFLDQDPSDPAFAITRDDHLRLFFTYNY